MVLQGRRRLVLPWLWVARQGIEQPKAGCRQSDTAQNTLAGEESIAQKGVTSVLIN